jgi:catechol 2,3-dioxygenase-like lactoylglutathione lyase family enzyme
MKLNHFAVSANSIEEAEKFFKDLLGLKKTRSFAVSADLIKEFFDVEREEQLLRYEGGEVAAEIFINQEREKNTNIFAHVCLEMENRDSLVEKADKLGFPVIKVPRKSGDSYYLFLKDNFGNIYEIKSK